MSKLLGIREELGFYEPMGTVERVYTPYTLRALGQNEASYDLNEPGAVKEIKDVLVALGRYQSDPVAHPNDAQIEQTYKSIDRSPSFEDAWDGASADAFVLAIGRYKDLGGFLFSPGAFAQLQPQVGQFGGETIVGGPQPTVSGLEVLAQAARKLLHGSPQLDRYVSWRGGSLSNPFSAPPKQNVISSTKIGRAWDPHGWTVAWRNGPVATANPDLLNKLDMIEGSLKTSWNAAQLETSEQARKARADALGADRVARDAVVRQLNKGAPEPTCSEQDVWSAKDGACVPRCDPSTTYNPATQQCELNLPPVEIITPQPLSTVAKLAIGAGAAAIGFGLVSYLRGRWSRGAAKSAAGSWIMVAPKY
jgi:hypothetical protein